MTERHNPSYLYSGYMTVNRNKKKIAVVSDYFEQLEIYDYDLNLLQITRLRKDPNFIGDWRSSLPVNSETVTYYNDIDTYGNNIYVLYDNRSMEDRKAGVCSEEASEVHIFNWSGEPLQRYQLEGCPRRIAYDHINDRIIGRFITKDSAKTIGYYQL